MDHFGIGAAMRSMIRTYRDSARHTGRTTSLVDSLKSGDVVVFLTGQEAERVRRLCLERDVSIGCVVTPLDEAGRLFERGSVPGDNRLIFDHSWVEAFYEHRIKLAMGEIDTLQRELSGYGATHRETRRAAIERSKWGYDGR